MDVRDATVETSSTSHSVCDSRTRIESPLCVQNVRYFTSQPRNRWIQLLRNMTVRLTPSDDERRRRQRNQMNWSGAVPIAVISLSRPWNPDREPSEQLVPVSVRGRDPSSNQHDRSAVTAAIRAARSATGAARSPRCQVASLPRPPRSVSAGPLQRNDRSFRVVYDL